MRHGALDSSISDAVPNDFQTFFTQNRTIRFIGCNGTLAHTTFVKHAVKTGTSEKTQPTVLLCVDKGDRCVGLVKQLLGEDVVVVRLPSTSPAHAMKNALQTKTAKWKELLLDRALAR